MRFTRNSHLSSTNFYKSEPNVTITIQSLIIVACVQTEFQDHLMLMVTFSEEESFEGGVKPGWTGVGNQKARMFQIC